MEINKLNQDNYNLTIDNIDLRTTDKVVVKDSQEIQEKSMDSKEWEFFQAHSQKAVAHYLKLGSNQQQAKIEKINEPAAFDLELTSDADSPTKAQIYYYTTAEDLQIFVKQNPQIQDLTLMIPRSYEFLLPSDIDLGALEGLKDLKHLALKPSQGQFYPYEMSSVVKMCGTLPSLPTLASFDLNLFGYQSNPSDEFRRIEEIIDHIAIQFPQLKKLNINNFGPIWDEIWNEEWDAGKTPALRSLSKLVNLEELHMQNVLCVGASHSLDFLKHLSKLKVLDFSGNYFCKQINFKSFLGAFLSHPSLESLNMSRIKGTCHIAYNFTLEDFPADKYPPSKLIHLNLDFNPIFNFDAAHIFPHLRTLSLRNVNLSHMHCQDLGKFTSLESLNLASATFSPENREQLSWITLPNLKCLDLSHSAAHGLTIAHLAPNLSDLNLAQSNVTSGDIKNLIHMTDLKNLDLSHTKISTSTLNFLAKLLNLETLNLSGNKLQDGDFKKLAQLNHLTTLDLSQVQMSVANFKELGSLTQLQTLNISNLPNSNITIELIEQLEQELPNTKVIFNKTL